MGQLHEMVFRYAVGAGDFPDRATAPALLDGWALKKVPIMEHVLSASIAAWQVKEYGLAIDLPDEAP